MGCDAYVDRMSSNRPDSPVDDPIEDTGILRFRFRTSRTSEKNIIFYALWPTRDRGSDAKRVRFFLFLISLPPSLLRLRFAKASIFQDHHRVQNSVTVHYLLANL